MNPANNVKLEQRNGNWVAIIDHGTSRFPEVRPATKSELWLWLMKEHLERQNKSLDEQIILLGDTFHETPPKA